LPLLSRLGAHPSVAKLREVLDRRGDWLVTCANVFQLSGFCCTDVLYLQSLMIIGNGSMALYFVTRMPPLGVAFAWAALKVCVNIFMVIKIFNERQPVRLAAEELEFYEEHFMPFGITARQFKRFWDLGETRVLEGETLLTEEGKKVEAVCLVLNGNVYRTVGGNHVRSLDTFPGARYASKQGDAGAWVGELTMLRSIDSGCQSSTVKIQQVLDEEALRVRHMQSALTELGLYDGELDGLVGGRTSRALSKLQEKSGLTFDNIDHARAATEQLVTNLGLQTSAWTAHACKGTTIRSWKLEPLLELCRSDKEMRGLLRKAFSQSTIKKLMAMQPDQPQAAEPAAPHDCKAQGLDQCVLNLYKGALTAALAKGSASPQDKVSLNQFRRDQGISDTQHAEALDRIGWTVDEYTLGSLFSRVGDVSRCRAAQVLRAGVGDQNK